MINFVVAVIMVFNFSAPSDVSHICFECGLVTAVEQAECDGVFLIAVLTKPIYTKSEGDRLIKNITEDVEKLYPRHMVIVTRDCGVYSKLKIFNQSGETAKVAELVQKVKQNRV